MAKSKRQKGTSALRSGRWSGKNHIYHVTTRTFAGVPIFRNFGLGRLVVKHIRREENEGHVKTLAFVVMPNHMHWLFQSTSDRRLSIVVNNVKSFSARQINLELNRTGRVWQKGFHDRAIRRDDDIVVVARYIVANPLRAGIALRLGDYPLWDSIWV